MTVANARVLWSILQQPDLRTYQDLPNVGAEAFAELVAKRPAKLQRGTAGRFEWLVQAAGVRRPLGWVSLRVAEREIDAGEIGYSILRQFRGRGHATEAVRALLTEAFGQGRLARVHAYWVAGNEPSRRLLERLGFAAKGVLPHGATVAGHAVDVLVHCLERDAWNQSGNSIEIPASGYPA